MFIHTISWLPRFSVELLFVPRVLSERSGYICPLLVERNFLTSVEAGIAVPCRQYL